MLTRPLPIGRRHVHASAVVTRSGRRRHARVAIPLSAWGGRQHDVHGPRREQRSSDRGVPVLPRRAEDRVHPVPPDHRARDAADAAHRQPRMGRTWQRSASAVSAGRHQASWVGAPASMCIFSETCGSALALEHNGDLYSCDHFVEPAHKRGQDPRVRRTTMSVDCSTHSRS
jgi:hypothetical protein